MIWVVVVLVAGLVLLAGVYDLVARVRGRYRPTRDWEAARLRRKAQGRNLGPDRPR